MDLRHPFNTAAIPNEAEELYILRHDIVMPEMVALLNAGWAADLKGKADKAAHLYQGANIYTYLVMHAIFVYNYVKTIGIQGQECTTEDLETLWKIKCIECNLPCLSERYGTNYLKAWEALKDAYGIPDQEETCPESECCAGIGEMIINDDDDCQAFIIGDCDSHLDF